MRLIDEQGAQIGVMRTDEALRYAQDRDLDLVEVAAEARPPVVRVLDYSKYKYEQAQKQKQARKRQQNIVIREIKFRPKIAAHDYATKKGHVERFLRHKDKVKVTIMFRGREVTHPERGQEILDRLADELSELAVVEQRPQQDGRNMTMMLGPSKAVLAGTLGEDEEGAEGDADGEPVAEEGVSLNGDATNGTGDIESTPDTTPDTTPRHHLSWRGERVSYPDPLVMPKMKTHSGAKKRFKVTGGGKVKARHAFTSHILEKKSPKRKRHLGRPVILADEDAKRVKKLLGAKTK